MIKNEKKSDGKSAIYGDSTCSTYNRLFLWAKEFEKSWRKSTTTPALAFRRPTKDRECWARIVVYTKAELYCIRQYKHIFLQNRCSQNPTRSLDRSKIERPRKSRFMGLGELDLARKRTRERAIRRKRSVYTRSMYLLYAIPTTSYTSGHVSVSSARALVYGWESDDNVHAALNLSLSLFLALSIRSTDAMQVLGAFIPLVCQYSRAVLLTRSAFFILLFRTFYLSSHSFPLSRASYPLYLSFAYPSMPCAPSAL